MKLLIFFVSKHLKALELSEAQVEVMLPSVAVLIRATCTRVFFSGDNRDVADMGEKREERSYSLQPVCS